MSGSARLAAMVVFTGWVFVAFSRYWDARASVYVITGLLTAAVAVGALWAPWCRQMSGAERRPAGAAPLRDTVLAIGVLAFAATIVTGVVWLTAS